MAGHPPGGQASAWPPGLPSLGTVRYANSCPGPAVTTCPADLLVLAKWAWSAHRGVPVLPARESPRPGRAGDGGEPRGPALRAAPGVPAVPADIGARAAAVGDQLVGSQADAAHPARLVAGLANPGHRLLVIHAQPTSGTWQSRDEKFPGTSRSAQPPGRFT